VERRVELGTRNPGQGTGNEAGPRRKGDDIAERLLDAVEDVRRLLPGLRGDAAAKHVSKQLWRAVTGGGANYEEARGAESRADFVHKVRIATKELREAHYWLRVVQRSSWLAPGSADSLVHEIDQLIAILVASARTAKSSGSP
jgi:four helix bundle protein